MVRAAWTFVLLVISVPAQVAPDGAQAPSRTSTQAMLQELQRLEPEAGWLATPPGLTDEVWSYYRIAFQLAPEGNEPDDARVGLGQMLFFDRRLSRDRTLSCASCHDPAHGFAEPRARSVGIGGQQVARNAPTILNVGLQRRFFHDGRVDTLEEQAVGPLLHPAEMGMPDRAAVVERVRELPEYTLLFGLAYGREPTFDDVVRALAAFQRSLVFVDAPFDRYRAGDEHAISADAAAGFELFAEHCRSCHTVSLRQPSFSDGNFHNVGVGFPEGGKDGTDHRALAREAFARLRGAGGAEAASVGEVLGEFGELGRALISRDEFLVGAFKTAPLRNVALTAPYMHDGSMPTLWHVVEHYNRGGTPNTWQDPQIRPLELDADEVDQIVAFLFSLTDRRFQEQGERALEAQRRIARPAGKPPAGSAAR